MCCLAQGLLGGSEWALADKAEGSAERQQNTTEEAVEENRSGSVEAEDSDHEFGPCGNFGEGWRGDADDGQAERNQQDIDEDEDDPEHLVHFQRGDCEEQRKDEIGEAGKAELPDIGIFGHGAEEAVLNGPMRRDGDPEQAESAEDDCTEIVVFPEVNDSAPYLGDGAEEKRPWNQVGRSGRDAQFL